MNFLVINGIDNFNLPPIIFGLYAIFNAIASQQHQNDQGQCREHFAQQTATLQKNPKNFSCDLNFKTQNYSFYQNCHLNKYLPVDGFCLQLLANVYNFADCCAPINFSILNQLIEFIENTVLWSLVLLKSVYLKLPTFIHKYFQ